MSNYYVKTIERAAVPRSRRLREAGGYHSGGTSSPGGEYLPLTGGTITGDLRVRGNFIVGDVVIVMDADGRLHISKGVVSDGDLAAFSAEEGEEGGSGGLDIARLWEELAAEDTSKVIDVSHIPGSVVLQDELIEVLDDYPLTTEMNEALSGKAGKDWVEEELAKYLLLTGGKISGDLEVTGTLKIGEAVLSYQDGRLRISKGVVSDGDLAAFAAEEGEEGGSGGLDIARLWEELAAEDASKVIDVSHIPGSVVLQDELVKILDDYPLTTEMNTALAGKAALKHTHIIADVSGLQSALNSKWEWNATQVAGVKVSNAVAADRLAASVNINGSPFNGESGIITARWGATRTITVWDFYNANKQTAQGIDGSADFSLKLPQSIKVKTLNIDGVTLSVVGGRLHVDSTLTADGDLVAYGDGEGSSGGGLDEEAMWAALGGSMSSKVISPSHLPSLSSLSGNLDSSRITGLDSALTSYAKKDGSNATGTWGISISGNAASADISNYLYLNPNSGSHAAQNDAVPANGRFAIYDVNANTTAGGSDGYIMAFRWPSGNYASQIYVDVDNTGIMALRHRDSASAWHEWYRILHSGNIGSYALTPSNYTSTLDSRYVKKAGDTMTGILELDRAGESVIRYWISGVKKGATGYLNGTGAYLYSWPAGKCLNITDAGSLLFGGSTVWHSGNNGSGSGLDADLLDGNHASRYTRCQGAYNYITFTVGGDANTYYPVHIHSVSDYYPSTLVNITRRYNETAPNTWNTASHRGGLTLCILWNNSVYWDGNGAGNPFQRVLECVQTYSTMVGGLDTSHYNGGGMIVWLRGGGAVYHVYSDQGTELSVSVYLSSFTDSANRTFAPTTTPKSIDSWRQLDIKTSSATKLATSRTLWGQSFDGTGNVSGDMSGVGDIGMSGDITGFTSLLSKAGDGNRRTEITSDSFILRAATTGWAHGLVEARNNGDYMGYIAGAYGSGDNISNYYFYGGQYDSPLMVIKPSSGNVGIGTTAPAYKLDVRGDIRSSGYLCSTMSGVTSYIGSENSSWLHFYTSASTGFYFDKLVSVNGDFYIYKSGGRLYIPSSEGNQKYYIRIE